MQKVKADIIVGDNRETLKTLPEKSVQCVVTSPPYWGLRDYGTAKWVGGDPDCTHRRESKKSDKTITGHKNFTEMLGVGDAIYKDVCPRCGAKREDDQIGLEQTPAEYIEQLCKVFDEVWRVLADDGTLWVNLGDSYAAFRDSKASPDTLRFGDGTKVATAPNRNSAMLKQSGLKHKDLVGIPWRFAFAMQERGWYLRQDIIWAKPNPMPESVTDRCTKSHEYIFLLTKSATYFYDHEAVKEPAVTGVWDAMPAMGGSKYGNNDDPKFATKSGNTPASDGMRNKRDVWTIATKPYAEAHFATYPVELILPCIKAGSKEGDIVLDPFSESGTTGEVALQLGRNYIGTELNPEYAALSEKRITNAIGMFGEVNVK
jgi:DNA modification methylase